MTALILFLFFCQALGAFIGVVTAAWGEILYIGAVREGKEIDHARREHLRLIGHSLRFGMTLSLMASFFLVVLSYALHTSPQPALTASYWMFIVFTLLIIASSWALARKKISFALGSAALLTAWWLLAYLTLGRLPVGTFSSAIALYIVLTAVVYAALRFVRFFVLDSAMKRRLPKP